MRKRIKRRKVDVTNIFRIMGLKKKGDDLITIDVFRNGIRQRAGRYNDYTLTQTSRKSFRVRMR